MRVNFPDNSFMLSWPHIRAWFDADGCVKDAEYKRTYRGHPSTVAVAANHRKVWAWLDMQGRTTVHASRIAWIHNRNK